MKVSLLEVINVLDNLISGKLSREDVSDWARKRQVAEDVGKLEYEPASKEQEIWDAILYLEGVDLKDGTNSYLHVVGDFQNYKCKLNV
ncbi:hypothetical protein [Psychromonas sp. L1A2]|uniref:hypothetical protein n=1 Tax=Psychromonas sp. L1A2 TaxID=2686356 RepID=UPI001359B814|nr:hypothetical protein [Psychromonas sp. L1A2]